MVLPTIRRRLTLAAIFALSLILALPFATFIPIEAHAQQAKLGPISIRSVYTTDANQKNQTDFAPGDNINYHVDVDNNTGSQIPIDVQFEVIANSYNPTDILKVYSYNNTIHIAKMPTGYSRFYTPVTIPYNSAHGDYSIRITVTPSDSASPANDGDWGESDFTIKQLQPDPYQLNVELDQVQGIAAGIECLKQIAELPIPIAFLSPHCIEVLAEGSVRVPEFITCLNDSGCRAQIRKHPFFP